MAPHLVQAQLDVLASVSHEAQCVWEVYGMGMTGIPCTYITWNKRVETSVHRRFTSS